MSNSVGFIFAARKLLFVVLLLALPWSVAQGGSITGTIRDAQTGQPLGRMDLDVFNIQLEQVLGIDTPGMPNDDNSAEDGSFLLEPLPAGRYYVRVDPSLTQGYPVQYYPEVFLQSQAVSVQVRSNGVVNLDFYLSRGHRCRGRVVDAITGAPLAGVDLDLYGADGTFVDYVDAITDLDGFFNVGPVPDGNFYLRADPSGNSDYLAEFYGGSVALSGSQLVHVAGGDALGLEFKLDLGGSLNGVVTDRATGAPLAGVDIDVFDQNGAFLDEADATTDVHGVYRVSSLPDGLYYVLADPTAAQGYLDTYFGDTSQIASAARVAVSRGTTASGVSIGLPLGGTLGGTVTDASTGQPLAHVGIDVWSGNTRVARTHSEADGTYLAGAVPTGAYIVRCDGVPELELAFQYHTGVMLASQATPIAVQAGSSAGSIDFALRPGGWISGTVATRMGDPMAGVSIDVYTPAGEVLPSLDTNTDAGGHYRIGPIPASTFVVRANPGSLYPEFTPRYYGGTIQLSTAQPLTVTAGATLADIDFPYGTIERQIIPRRIQEIAATPNPFNPRTRLAFDLEVTGPVKVTIHDVRGRVLAVLADGVMEKGRHELLWDGQGVLGQDTSSGVHFVRLETATRVVKQKLILLK